MAIPTIDRSKLTNELNALLDRYEYTNTIDAMEANPMFHVKQKRNKADRAERHLVSMRIKHDEKHFEEHFEHWEACASCGVENHLVRSGKLWLQPNHNCEGNKMANARH